MKTKINVDGVEYTVTPIPPSLAPVQILVDKLMSKTPENFEDAMKISEELGKATAKLLSATVTPQPTPEAAIEVFKATQAFTIKTIKEAQFFRNPAGPDGQQSGVNGTNPT